MDISSIERSDTVTLKIHDPWYQPTDMEVVIYGSHTKQYRQSVLESQRTYSAEGKRAGDDEEFDSQRGARLLQSAICSWKNVQFKGKDIEPDSAEAHALMADGSNDWFTAQIKNAINKQSLFFSVSAKS